MLPKTFYQREIPDTLITFSSPEGKKIFKKSLEEENMECFFPLIEQFHTQGEPAYCGLGTLVVILNALGVDPKRTWKGPWRWFSEELLNCCKNLEEIKKDGITIFEFKCLSNCNGANCEIIFGDKVTLEEFREDLKKHAKMTNEFLAISYDRATLKQTGSGHFSPFGGYNEELDKVLILDVARFKYPPYWCDTKLLWESMQPKDSATGLPRGYARIKTGKREQFSLFYKIKASPDQFQSFSNQYFKHVSKTLCDDKFDAKIEELKSVFDEVFHVFVEIGTNESAIIIEKLYEQAKQTNLYKTLIIDGIDMKYVTLYILLFYSMPLKTFSIEQDEKILKLRGEPIEEIALFNSTVSFFRNQMKVIKQLCCEKCDCKSRE